MRCARQHPILGTLTCERPPGHEGWHKFGRSEWGSLPTATPRAQVRITVTIDGEVIAQNLSLSSRGDSRPVRDVARLLLNSAAVATDNALQSVPLPGDD